MYISAVIDQTFYMRHKVDKVAHNVLQLEFLELLSKITFLAFIKYFENEYIKIEKKLKFYNKSTNSDGMMSYGNNY